MQLFGGKRPQCPLDEGVNFAHEFREEARGLGRPRPNRSAHLIAEGFAFYSSELERCEAAINFIALVEFYKDWLENAEEGNREHSYGEVPACLNLSAFRLGQLIGRHSDFLDDPDFSPYEGQSADEQLFRNSIFHLELQARPKVVAALQGSQASAIAQIGDLGPMVRVFP